LKIKRWGVAAAAAVAGALALAGCSTGGGSEVQSGTTVSIAQNAAMTSMNALTALNYSTYNSNISYMYQSTFNYYDSDQKLVKNTKFGTYKLVSSDPLVVKYTINDGVKWSDGTPVTAADMVLSWASSITKYNDPKGVNFGGVAAGGGWDLIKDVPKISDDNRSATFTFDKPFVDWEPVTALNPNVPAHIVWELAKIDDKKGADAAKELTTAFQKDDTAKITKLAKVWKTGFDMTSTPKDKRLLVTDGPYTVTTLTKQYVTLSANKDYTWGPKPKIEKITVRFIPDQTSQVQALDNGEIKVLYGQATQDTVKALQGLKGVTWKTSPEAAYEHIDLTMNNDGPFSPKTYGGDAAKALAVRQAFLKIVPRQEMLEKIIKPLNEQATLMDSSLFLPGQEGYDGAVKDNDSSEYQKVDVDAAKALLAQAGVSGSIDVRFAYPTDNPRRVSEFQLLQASAKLAGFNLVDVGKPTAEFFGDSGLGSGKYDYDATVFAYVQSGNVVTGSEGNTTTGNAYNYQGYSNPEVDALWKQAEVAKDFSAAVPFMQKIDGHLWKDASTITLYQLADVQAWSNDIQNVTPAPFTPNIFWNFFDWSIKGKG
jgi:peptide/nickel transport system substrate-binding protein